MWLAQHLQTRHGGEHGGPKRLNIVQQRHRRTLIESDATTLLHNTAVQQSLQHVGQGEVRQIHRRLANVQARVETSTEWWHQVLVGDENSLCVMRGRRFCLRNTSRSWSIADGANVIRFGRRAGNAMLLSNLFNFAHRIQFDTLRLRRRKIRTALEASSLSASVISSIWMITFRGTVFSTMERIFTVSTLLHTILFISVSLRMWRIESAPRVS